MLGGTAADGVGDMPLGFRGGFWDLARCCRRCEPGRFGPSERPLPRLQTSAGVDCTLDRPSEKKKKSFQISPENPCDFAPSQVEKEKIKSKLQFSFPVTLLIRRSMVFHEQNTNPSFALEFQLLALWFRRWAPRLRAIMPYTPGDSPLCSGDLRG